MIFLIQIVFPELKITDNDTLELKKKIMKMTPDQRKRLGINKSTLWYMKKNIAEGKNIKVYDKMLSRLNVTK